MDYILLLAVGKTFLNAAQFVLRNSSSRFRPRRGEAVDAPVAITRAWNSIFSVFPDAKARESGVSIFSPECIRNKQVAALGKIHE